MEYWIPQPKQAEVLLNDAFESLAGGSRGGGKTDAGIVWLIDPAYMQFSSYRALVLRKSYEDLKDWISRAKVHYAAYGGIPVGTPAVFRFPDGQEIRMGHLKDKKSYEKYLGHEYQKILIEELTTIPSEEIYMEILGSLRSSNPKLVPRILSTTNPGGIGHRWVKSRFIDYGIKNQKFYPDELEGRSRIFIPMFLEDNQKLREADPGYEKYLEGLKYKNPILYKRWRLGSWDIFEGQFFDTFDTNIHVVKPYIPSWAERKRTIISFDYGYSAPSAVYWMTKDTQGNIVIYREFYKNQHTYRQLAREILDYNNGEKYDTIVCDPAIVNKKTEDSGQTAKEIFADEGLSIIGANNDRMARSNLYRDLLALREIQPGQLAPTLTITESCPHLISQLSNLIRSTKNVEDIEDGQEDHAYDGAGYGLMEISPPVSDMKSRSAVNDKLKRKNSDYGSISS